MVDYYGGGLPYQIHIDIVKADGSVLNVSDMLTSRDDLHIIWNYDGASPHEARFRLSAAQGAGLSDIHEELEVRIYDDWDATQPYPRLFNGYIKGFDPDDEGPNERFIDIFAQSKFLLLTESQSQPGDEGHPNPFEIGPLYPYWVANTAYALNTYIQPSYAHLNGYYYKATTAGTSGSSEPTWPTTPGATVSDGSVVWTNQGLAPTQYLLDNLAINALVAEYEPTLSTSGVTQVVGAIQYKGVEDANLLQAIGDIGSQAGTSTYSSWQPSHAYSVGNTVQPTSINGRYYTCIVSGTSNGTEPTWPPNLGDIVLDGGASTVQWQCAGYTQKLPFPYVTITPDNVGHTAAWTPVLNWVDENSLSTHTIEFSDSPTETGTLKHYSTSPRRRDSKGFANKQTVTGATGSSVRATYTDSTGVAYIGRTISAPIVNKSDLTDQTLGYSLGQRLLRSSHRVHETVSITLPPGGADLTPLITAPKKIKLTKQLEGIVGTIFACPRFTLDFHNGIPVWGMELGQTFRRLNADDVPVFLGGVEYAGDAARPHTPTWAAGNAWLIENSYNAATQLATVEVQWIHGGELTLFGFDVRWWYSNGPYHYDFVAYTGGTTANFRTTTLLPGATWNVQVRARKLNGLMSDWSGFQTFSTALTVTQNIYNGGFEVASPNDPTLALGWDTSGSTGSGSRQLAAGSGHSGINAYKLIVPNNVSTSYIGSAKAGINARLPVQLWFWAWSSPAGNTGKVQITWYDNGLNVIRTDTLASALYLAGGYNQYVWQVMPPTNAAALSIQITALFGSASTNVYVDDVGIYQPAQPPNPPNDGGGGGVGSYPFPLQLVQADANTTYEIDTTSANTYRGQASHALGVPTTSNATIKYQGMPQAATAGEVWSAWSAVKSTNALGTTKLLLRWFDSSDALISESTIYTGTPTTSFVEQQGQATAPANTRYVRVSIYYQQAGIAGSAPTAYFAPPRAFKAVNTPDSHYDIQTNPFRFYRTNGDYMGSMSYATGADPDGRVTLDISNPSYAPYLTITSAGGAITWQNDGVHVVPLISTGQTSLPTSPAPTGGETFLYRPSSGPCVWVFYDGTRWLGVDKQRVDLKKGSATRQTFSATTTPWTEAGPPDDGSWYVEKITWWGSVATTNNGTNYWTLRLAKYDNGFGGSVVQDVNTSAKTAGANWAISASPGVVVDFSNGNAMGFFTEIRKDNGAPGNITIVDCALVLRRVYT